MKQIKDPVKAAIKKSGEPESKHTKSVRIVCKRTQNALKDMRLIGNCAGRDYELKPDEVNSVMIALNGAVTRVQNQFDGKVNADDGFTL